MELTPDQLDALLDLTEKQRKAVLHYMSGKSKAEAYTDAGYQSSSRSTASKNASKLFETEKVKKAVRLLMQEDVQEQVNDSILSRERALEILNHQAECSLDEVLDFFEVEIDTLQGPVKHTLFRLKDTKNWSEKVKASIKSITLTKQGPKIELYDRQNAVKITGQIEEYISPKGRKSSGFYIEYTPEEQ